MKTKILLACVCLGALASAFAEAPKAGAEKAVLAAEKEWADAVLHRDQSKLDALLDKDLEYTHSSGKIQTKAEFIDDVMKTTQYQSIDFQTTKVRQFGNAAVISHKAVVKTVNTGTSNLYLSETWIQQNGKWQMVSRLATKLP